MFLCAAAGTAKWAGQCEREHSYQVCLGCGIKRLFDEKKFHGYGPYGYDVKKLIAREQAVRARQRRIPACGGCGTCRGRQLALAHGSNIPTSEALSVPLVRDGRYTAS
jgi:hypothetical protein